MRTFLLIFVILISFFSSEVLCWKKWLRYGPVVFADEFLGNSLNETNWEFDESCSEIFGPKNLQCYVRGSNNVEVKNGILHIKAKLENYEFKRYTSARITQKSDDGFRYGAYVVRARFPKGSHLGSQIWLQSDYSNCLFEQIDIVRHQGQKPSEILTKVFYGRKKDHAISNEMKASPNNWDFSKDFHDFAVIWLPERLYFYIDDVRIHKVSFNFGNSTSWDGFKNYQIPCLGLGLPFASPARFVINLSVGGSTLFEDDPEGLDVKEARKWEKTNLEIDWVRIFQMYDGFK